MADRKLKIGLILDTSLDTSEGVPQYVVAVGEWLRGRGHDVHYLVGQSARRDLANIHSLARNVAVRFNGTTTTIPLPANRRRLRRLIRQADFDVLHVQTPHHPLMAQHLITAAGSRTAVIATFHILPFGPLSRWGSRLLGVTLRPSLRRVDRLLAVSTAAADFCQWSFGMTAKVVPNVIDYRRFRDAKPLPAYDDDTVTILFLGRLVERKGCQMLLEAVARLAGRHDLPPFRLVICGRGHLRPQLETFVRQHRLEGVVSFAGFVTEADKPRYYASADLAVFPSRGGESFGIVLAEAMASGRPAVLAGDNPGYRSVMTPRIELLFDPTDIEALTNKLVTYITDARTRRKMAAWGAAHSRQFDVNTVGKQLLDIYRRALQKRQRA